MKQHWPIRSELTMINGIAMKVRRIIVPFLLQRQILVQVQSQHIGIKKIRLLVKESVDWMNMNADIENTTKCSAPCLEYQQTQLHEKTIRYEVPFQLGRWLGLIPFLLKIEHFCAL